MGLPPLTLRPKLCIVREAIVYADTISRNNYSILHFIIYKVMKYRKILMKYNVYFIFSLVKI